MNEKVSFSTVSIHQVWVKSVHKAIYNESNSFKELFMRKSSNPGQIDSFWKPQEQIQAPHEQIKAI